ncbi:MAG: VCBS repeat-containing protein [Deltaproteobacteria bacterium]|nr:VCBS repeat-containing protein [Deltaproteobacteria bacterium]
MGARAFAPVPRQLLRPSTVRAAALFLLCPLPALAAPGVDLRRIPLTLEGRTAHVVTRDLDGDGLAELAATARQGTDRAPVRRLALWQVGVDGPTAEPTQLLTLPDNAVVVDFCDVLPAPGAEVVLLTADGLSVFTHVDATRYADTAVPLVEIPGVLGFPDEEDAPFYQVCRAPRGAATAVELWVPTGRGLAIAVPDGAGVRVERTLPLRPRAYHTSGDEFRGPRARRDFALMTQVLMPRLVNVDADGDGDDDLYQVVEDTLKLFLRRDGRLDPAPVNERSFELRTETDRARRNAVLDVMLGDLDGDGLPDAVATKLAGGLTSLRTETRYYPGRGVAGFAADPTSVRRVDGYATPLALLDVDADGRLELLEPVIRTTPMAVAGMLVRQRVDADLRVLRAVGGTLREGRSMTLPFGLDTGAGSVKGGPPLVGQDFNGDGRPDLVNLGSGNEAVVLLGVAGDPPFADDEAFSARVPSTSRAEWYVPWPRGPASFVMAFPDQKAAAGKLVLFFNARSRQGRIEPRSP